MARPRLARLEAPLRVAAALVGTLPVAVLSSVCLARVVPLSEGARGTLGFSLVVPLWVAAMCVAFLARNAARAWGVCAALTAALAAIVYGAPL
ncbi:hypothetical protein SOCEGT47_044330 [Sorangium cellulosum]|uniref:Uncharacterized protein n=1 Tax=Sorangium cellulosum TaxID=56 RepID=A0A4P2Q4P9_SORCE|nr:hypothetical protein [Sorangium cellulosum]AUX23903.1 hypothetical protein SOCEGT47_044330 [Sorangium cellulosum]